MFQFCLEFDGYHVRSTEPNCKYYSCRSESDRHWLVLTVRLDQMIAYPASRNRKRDKDRDRDKDIEGQRAEMATAAGTENRRRQRQRQG